MATNYGLKQFVLSNYNDALKLQRRLSYLNWYLPYVHEGNTDLSFDDALLLDAEREELSMRFSLLYLEAESNGLDRNDIVSEVNRLNDAFYARLCRLRKRVVSMVCNYDSLWFLTLTFNDQTFARTSSDYRRRIVKEFLQDYPEYVANVDFGKKNGREHFHALIGGYFVNECKWRDRGFIYPELVNLDLENDIKAVAKYVAKLSNHAVKETAKQNKLIYSRSKRNGN